jgi:hypothetical protein
MAMMRGRSMTESSCDAVQRRRALSVAEIVAQLHGSTEIT